MDNITGIYHVATMGTDLEKARTFYNRVLALPEIEQFNLDGRKGAIFAFAPAYGRSGGSLSVTVDAETDRQIEPVSPSGAVVLGVRAGFLSRWQTYLTDHAVKVTGRAWAFGEEHLCFTDPSGFDLAMVENAPAEGADVPPAARQAHPLGPLTLRSVELQAQTTEDDLPRLLSLLGLKVSGQVGPLIRFTMASEGQADNIDVLCRPRRTAWRGAELRLRSVALQVAGAESLPAVAKTIAEHGFITRQSGGPAAPVWVRLAQAGIDLALCAPDQRITPLLDLRMWDE